MSSGAALSGTGSYQTSPSDWRLQPQDCEEVTKRCPFQAIPRSPIERGAARSRTGFNSAALLASWGQRPREDSAALEPGDQRAQCDFGGGPSRTVGSPASPSHCVPSLANETVEDDKPAIAASGYGPVNLGRQLDPLGQEFLGARRVESSEENGPSGSAMARGKKR